MGNVVCCSLSVISLITSVTVTVYVALDRREVPVFFDDFHLYPLPAASTDNYRYEPIRSQAAGKSMIPNSEHWTLADEGSREESSSDGTLPGSLIAAYNTTYSHQNVWLSRSDSGFLTLRADKLTKMMAEDHPTEGHPHLYFRSAKFINNLTTLPGWDATRDGRHRFVVRARLPQAPHLETTLRLEPSDAAQSDKATIILARHLGCRSHVTCGAIYAANAEGEMSSRVRGFRNLSHDFHTYELVWLPADRLDFYLDGLHVHQVSLNKRFKRSFSPSSGDDRYDAIGEPFLGKWIFAVYLRPTLLTDWTHAPDDQPGENTAGSSKIQNKCDWVKPTLEIDYMAVYRG